MPRPDKPINSGRRLEDPAKSLRPQTWTKYGIMESSDTDTDETEAEADGVTVEVTVDEVTVVDQAPGTVPNKYAGRSSSAWLYSDVPADPTPEPETEWVVERSIDGRSYRRVDTLTIVEETATG